MKISKLPQLAAKHARGALVEQLYLRTGIDTTRPTVVYGIVNERCNYRCRYCEYWRMKEYGDEMTVEQWTDALGSLKQFIGTYHVEFSGGEPFRKKGFLDILRFCQDQGIRWGVTTNGSAFSEKIVRQTVAAEPFNVNISIDGHRSEIHDYMRGVPGSLDRIVGGIGRLRQQRTEQGRDFPIIIKPTVHSKNFRELPDLVRWAQGIGVTAINFQPVDRWTQETYDELWIERGQHAELEKVVAELIAMKRDGAPILNTELVMDLWTSHFREEKAPAEALPCRVGMRNYFIRPNGDVELCWFYPPIGNVKQQPARDIWRGQLARERRKETVECTKLCLFTCLSQKTLWDKAKMALTLIKGDRKSRPAVHSEPAADEPQETGEENRSCGGCGTPAPVTIDLPEDNSLPIRS
jgi:MoaA/NifB/PqqE/SkfB family radical SAM enzyme